MLINTFLTEYLSKVLKAADAGTYKQFTIHLITRLLNTLTAASEYRYAENIILVLQISLSCWKQLHTAAGSAPSSSLGLCVQLSGQTLLAASVAL